MLQDYSMDSMVYCVTLLIELHLVHACVLANCISANFISIQSGFGLSQVLRHSVEGRKKHMSKYIHIEPDCSQTSWLQFDK